MSNFINVFCFTQVTRIVLLWVNNHFNDFEGNPSMTQFLEDFEKLLDEAVRLTFTNVTGAVFGDKVNKD